MVESTETVYEHLSGSPTFTVTATEPWSKTMIRRLAEKRPEEVKIIYANEDGSVVAHIPFDWMRIVPKKQILLTAEQREAKAQRMREIGSKNKSSNN